MPSTALSARGLRPVSELGLRRPHGQRLRYMAGCRCLHCRMANTNYETARAKLRRAGLSNGIVSAGPARRHLRRLSKHGVGYKTAADAASVARSVVAKILSRERLRCRADTVRRILLVTTAARADHSIVPAAPTWRRVRRLLEEGFTKGWIAQQLGNKRAALQLRSDFVLARTELAVEKIWRRYVE